MKYARIEVEQREDGTEEVRLVSRSGRRLFGAVTAQPGHIRAEHIAECERVAHLRGLIVESGPF